MPVVVRDDGIEFAVYTYRETLSAKSSSLLRQEIQYLQSENGDYGRFFLQIDGDYEAVFSRDKGFLLGESVWEYFEQPDDLIFCEALPDSEDALLVVVRSGRVSLDVKVAKVNLPDEFASLVGSSNKYRIYIHGDVPLAQEASDEAFAFDEDSIESFTLLDEPVFPQLPLYEEYQLLSIPEAIRELNLGTGKPIFYVIAIVAAIGLGYFIYDIMQPEPEPVVVEVAPIERPPEDPYLAYKNALKGPSPSKILVEYALNVQHLFTMPAWQPTSVNYASGNYTASLQSFGGSTDILLAWVKETDANLTVTGDSASLSINSDVKDRKPPTKIYHERDIVSLIYDRLKLLLPAGGVSLGNSQPQDGYNQIELTVSFSDISSDILVLFAKELQGLPLIMQRCDASINDGLLSGSFSILILGAGNGSS